jgi:SAM-dependent methyltransferase
MRDARQEILHKVEAYYTAKVAAHGATPGGVDWNSLESQQLRFQQLLRIVANTEETISINDIGCGYGALVEYLRAHGHRFSYHGYDISSAMIARAQERYEQFTSCHFSTTFETLSPAHYAVACGIFNVKLDIPAEEWTAYVLMTIDQLAQLSTKGFAFNVLTAYADAHRQRPDLYYADPGMLFDYCQRRHSRWVALLHDYGLYEFTMLVRKEGP